MGLEGSPSLEVEESRAHKSARAAIDFVHAGMAGPQLYLPLVPIPASVQLPDMLVSVGQGTLLLAEDQPHSPPHLFALPCLEPLPTLGLDCFQAEPCGCPQPGSCLK